MPELEKETDWIISTIPGAKELKEWFGYWPSFHDAEIVSLSVHRSEQSVLSIYFWNTDWEQVLPDRHFFHDKHVVVHFNMKGVFDLDLNEFNHQNVIDGLIFEKIEGGIEILLSGCYGLCGSISCESVEISLTPGKPKDDLHSKA